MSTSIFWTISGVVGRRRLWFCVVKSWRSSENVPSGDRRRFRARSVSGSFHAAIALSSRRGAVKRKWTIWNIVSRSVGDPPAKTLSSSSSIPVFAKTTLPASALRRAVASNAPTPPSRTIASANFTES